MSLSEEPKVTITSRTVPDICNEVWTATHVFAKEVDVSTVTFTTTVWTGFLLTLKRDLERHGLLKDVQQYYTQSFSEVYRIGLDKVELLAKMKELMLETWSFLIRELGDLESKTKTIFFLEIAGGDLGQQIKEGDLSTDENYQKFQRIRSVLSSHVYDILHKETDPSPVDRSMAFRPEYAQPVPTTSPIPKPQPPKPQPAAPTQSTAKTKKKLSAGEILMRIAVAATVIGTVAVVLIFGFGVGVRRTYIQRPPATNPPATQAPETQPPLVELPRPTSGKIVRGIEYGGSELTVHASSDSDCVVAVKSVSGTTYTAFYIRAGQTATVGVPGQKLYVHFAYGTHWYGYGEGKMFGENTVYSKDDELLDFSEATWEYTLYPVTDGNFSETPSDEDEFF